MKLVHAQYEISFNELSKAGTICYCQDLACTMHLLRETSKRSKQKKKKMVIFIHQSLVQQSALEAASTTEGVFSTSSPFPNANQP